MCLWHYLSLLINLKAADLLQEEDFWATSSELGDGDAMVGYNLSVKETTVFLTRGFFVQMST